MNPICMTNESVVRKTVLLYEKCVVDFEGVFYIFLETLFEIL